MAKVYNDKTQAYIDHFMSSKKPFVTTNNSYMYRQLQYSMLFQEVTAEHRLYKTYKKAPAICMHAWIIAVYERDEINAGTVCTAQCTKIY